MIIIRKSNERGHSQIGWLNSFHTFSFSDYHDPQYMGFGNLRVINEDTVAAGQGFGCHAHRDMEIISYVIEGSIEHKDSMGTGSIINPGEIQRMSAGVGVEHSEFNHSKEQELHFLQIWIIPEERGLPASYEQKTIQKTANQFILIGSRQGGDNAIVIHQDVKLFVAYLDKQFSLEYEIQHARKVWLQVVKGSIALNGHSLGAGDGAAITDEIKLTITGIEGAEILLFNLA